MHYLSAAYFVSQPLHVSGIFVAHHQEVYCTYITTGTYCCKCTVYPPHDGLQICLKHLEVDWRNKLRINSASSWFSLHRGVISWYCIMDRTTTKLKGILNIKKEFGKIYTGADKSLGRLTSQCILFDGENISFDSSLVIYINITNISPIMTISKIYESQNLLSL
jgi:hypothetical protein